MEINTKQRIHVPGGFYCGVCSRLKETSVSKHVYECMYWYAILVVNKRGRVVKCDKCIAAVVEELRK